MQAPRADFLNAFEKTTLLESAQDLLDDTDVRTAITLKGQTSTSVNLETGIVTPTVTSDAVNAIRRTIEAGEAEASRGRLQEGDRVYLVEQADLTAELQAIDRIVDGTDLLEVIRWTEDVLGWCYLIQARHT